MKKYCTPEIEISVFDTEDIITASNTQLTVHGLLDGNSDDGNFAAFNEDDFI